MNNNYYIKDYKQLIVYKKSMDLVDIIYSLVQDFPKYETYALCDQLRRAMTSVPLNIAEGNVQAYPLKEVNFINNAIGSICEVECAIEIAYRQKYLSSNVFEEISYLITEMKKLLLKLIRSKQSLVENQKQDRQ